VETPQAHQNIITRCLPKTGQVTEYQAGDDGTYEAGWWKGRLNANNRTRFIAKTIGGDAIVLDRATGLMWAADGNAAGCNNGAIITWANAITYANGLTFATFSDWRVPNIFEIYSLLNFGATPLVYSSFFSNIQTGDFYWSNTTNPNDSLTAYGVKFVNGWIQHLTKTTSRYLICVRKGL